VDQLPNPPPRLSEAQRHFLLQAMGIQRYCLRAAAAEPSLAEEPVATPVTEPADTAERPLPPRIELEAAVPAANLAPTLSSAPTAPSAPAASTNKPLAAPRPAAAVGNSMSFQLLLLQTDRRLAVCVAIPQRPQTVLERSELQLLRNLLQWLGCRLLAEAPSRPFNWPLPGLGVTDAGHAGQALLGFLTQAQQDLGFSRLLVLGHASLAALEGVLVAAAAGWQGWYAPGLADMLQQPALKREVWQRLQTLHAGLAG
jgi:hypothetical protein